MVMTPQPPSHTRRLSGLSYQPSILPPRSTECDPFPTPSRGGSGPGRKSPGPEFTTGPGRRRPGPRPTRPPPRRAAHTLNYSGPLLDCARNPLSSKQSRQ